MFEQVLPGNTKSILALLEKEAIIQDAYLAGGTGLALLLGHRISYDLDFFTTKEFNENMLLPELEKISAFQLEKIAWKTILGNFSGVKFSIFYYNYPVICPTVKFGMINVANISDIAAMKIAAVLSRGTKRDFVDLYFICKEQLSLEDIIKLYGEKYKNLPSVSMHILKSLTYFEDAEREEMPEMLRKTSWKEIKQYFENEVKKLI